MQFTVVHAGGATPDGGLLSWRSADELTPDAFADLVHAVVHSSPKLHDLDVCAAMEEAVYEVVRNAYTSPKTLGRMSGEWPTVFARVSLADLVHFGPDSGIPAEVTYCPNLTCRDGDGRVDWDLTALERADRARMGQETSDVLFSFEVVDAGSTIWTGMLCGPPRGLGASAASSTCAPCA